MRILIHAVFAVAVAVAAAPLAAQASAARPIVAVFAHPDDERVVAPLLARLARRDATSTS